ncbi:hypothetical protein DFH28DRAFT_926904 [Melampsora americana]|nr:hypothetical protein DFH28DRAFT_926904 [Melampsora americana]
MDKRVSLALSPLASFLLILNDHDFNLVRNLKEELAEIKALLHKVNEDLRKLHDFSEELDVDVTRVQEQLDFNRGHLFRHERVLERMLGPDSHQLDPDYVSDSEEEGSEVKTVQNHYPQNENTDIATKQNKENKKKYACGIAQSRMCQCEGEPAEGESGLLKLGGLHTRLPPRTSLKTIPRVAVWPKGCWPLSYEQEGDLVLCGFAPYVHIGTSIAQFFNSPSFPEQSKSHRLSEYSSHSKVP